MSLLRGGSQKDIPPGKNRKILRSMDNGVKARQFSFAHAHEEFLREEKQMAQIKIAEIKDSLIEQLTLKGANIEVYRDLIDSYIFAQNLNEKCKRTYAKTA